MENSPPGIQAIPSGALPGVDFLFATVGWNDPASENAEAFVINNMAHSVSVLRMRSVMAIYSGLFDARELFDRRQDWFTLHVFCNYFKLVDKKQWFFALLC